MPLYDYYCKECGEVNNDVMISVGDLDHTLIYCTCGEVMNRRCGNAGFILKGSGWAADGYSHYIGDINKTRAACGKPRLNYEDIHGPIEKE